MQSQAIAIRDEEGAPPARWQAELRVLEGYFQDTKVATSRYRRDADGAEDNQRSSRPSLPSPVFLPVAAFAHARDGHARADRAPEPDAAQAISVGSHTAASAA